MNEKSSPVLLDVNVLIALGDPNHVHHKRASRWFFADPARPWATCPLVENGFVRILGQTTYPDFEGDSGDAREVLSEMTLAPGHQFWPDELSLADKKLFPALPLSRHLTDLYLLALAIRRQGRLATLDRRIDPALLSGGSTAYFNIPSE